MEIKLYLCDSESIEWDKTLTLVHTIQATFKYPYDIKNPTLILDVSNITPFHLSEFNYCSFSTNESITFYYFVIGKKFINNSLVELTLKRDVLQTYNFIDLSRIKGLITRGTPTWLDDFNTYPVDDRIPLKDYYSIRFDTIDLSDSNITFTEPENNSHNRIIVSSASATKTSGINDYAIIGDIPYITGTTLPKIKSSYRLNNNVFVATMNKDDYVGLCSYLDSNSNLATSVINAFISPFNIEIQKENNFDLFSQVFCLGGNNGYIRFDTDNTTPISKFYLPKFREYSDYLVLAKFTLSSNYNDDYLKFLDKEPYSITEVYLPYYGWYQLDRSKYLGDEFVVYYSCNFVTGESMVYLYDNTKSILVFSNAVQLLEPLVKSTTNSVEINNARTNIITNGVIGGVASAITGSLITKNPIGGAIAIGGSIVKTINALNQLLPTTSHTEHSGTSDLYNKKVVKVRTYYREVQDSFNLESFVHTNGYAINTYTDLDTISGYCEGKIEIPMNDSIYAIDYDDIKELENLFLTGVRLPEPPKD